MSGTIQLETDRLVLRRHLIKDAECLYSCFGLDEKIYEYSGWKPYETLEKAQQSVQCFINSYSNKRFYGWAIEYQNELIGTVGAYDYDPDNNSIEIGISIKQSCWGSGYASEALKCVISYLTESEGIKTIKAWCASENKGSQKAMEKAGMVRISAESAAIKLGDKFYDKLNYEYQLQ